MTSESTGKLPRLLRLYILSVFLLTLVSVGTKFICTYVLRLPEAYRFMVFPHKYFAIDLNCFIDRFRDFHHVSFFARDSAHGLMFMYPAVTALIYQFFFFFPKPKYGYLLLMVPTVLAIAWWFMRSLVRHGLARAAAVLFVGICLVTSYPLMVDFFLLNMELVLGVVIGLGLYFFLTGRSYAAAACFAIAGAAKIFPFIFLALLFQKKQYKQIVFAILLGVGLQLFAMWMLSGSVAVSQRGIAAGLENFRLNYALPFATLDTGIDHSLFGLIKGSITIANLPYPPLETMGKVLRVYLALTAVAGIALYFLRIQFLPALNQVLCMCTIAVLFTPASHDYTLMHLYVPFGMMVLLTLEASRTGQKIPGLRTAFVCFALLLAPLNEFVLHGNVIGSQIKAIVLVVLLVTALRFRFAGSEPSEYAPA